MKGLGLNEKNRRNRGGVVPTHSRVNIGCGGVGKTTAIYRNTKCQTGYWSGNCYGRHWYGMRLHLASVLPRFKSLYLEWSSNPIGGIWGAIYGAGYQQIYQFQEAVTRFIFKNFFGLSLGLGFVFAGL